MAEEQKEIDYKAELKATLASFEEAAKKGDEAVKALSAGVGRLASLTLTALQGTPFEEQAELLAVQLARAGVTVETLHNAPLKVTKTGGADIYKVMGVLQKAAEAEAEAEAATPGPQAKATEAPAQVRVIEEAAPQIEQKTGRK